MASFLTNRNTTQWRATLEGRKNNSNSEIMKVFKSRMMEQGDDSIGKEEGRMIRA